jgi:ATP-dependent Lon protease
MTQSNVYCHIEYDVIYSASIKRPYGDHKKCQVIRSRKSGNSTSTFASRQLKEHGLTSKDLTFKAIGKIVEGYTRESGVRGLEAKIAQVIRNAAKSVAMEEYNKKVTDEDIIRVLEFQD